LTVKNPKPAILINFKRNYPPEEVRTVSSGTSEAEFLYDLPFFTLDP
jgi:hypothetical protein